MAFLRNDAINRVNLHSGIQALAQGAGGIFFLVFLVRAGVSVPGALTAQAAILAFRFAIRPIILPLAIRFGLKPMLIAGTFGIALQYPLLAEVDGVGAALVALCIVAALGEVFYWPSYNAYFAMLGDDKHRGHQIGAREALVAVAGIVAPLLGAWALVTLGPRPMFAAVGLVQAMAALPLLGAPNVAVKASAPGALRAARLGAILYATDAWFDAWFVFVWQVALFLSLGESIAAYGGAMALAALVGAGGGLLLGRHVDLGHARRAVTIAYGAAAAVVAVRAASFGLPWLAVAANALGAFVLPLLLPVLGSATYTIAKASPCPLRFQIAAEAGWDLGCIAGCLTAAGLAATGVPLAPATLLALPALALAAALLRRHFASAAAPPAQTCPRLEKATWAELGHVAFRLKAGLGSPFHFGRSQRETEMNHTATAPRFGSRGRWTGLNIVLMIIGFAVFWPLGLAMLAYIIWGDEIRAKAEEVKGHFRSFGERAPRFRDGGAFGFQGGFQGRTGNAAFDEYRAQELKRLDEERRKVEAMRAEFETFLAELRRVKDTEEFDSFMREFRNRTSGGN